VETESARDIFEEMKLALQKQRLQHEAELEALKVRLKRKYQREMYANQVGDWRNWRGV
jgi:hypothetical protein